MSGSLVDVTRCSWSASGGDTRIDQLVQVHAYIDLQSCKQLHLGPPPDHQHPTEDQWIFILGPSTVDIESRCIIKASATVC